MGAVNAGPQPTSRAFYRAIKARHPIRDDLLSHQERGIQPRRNDPELRRIWDAAAVFETEGLARGQARQFPRLGGYLATLAVPRTIRAERTTATPGHESLWATPEELLRRVRRRRADPGCWWGWVMIYSVWDVEFNNLVGAYDTEAAALEGVRELVQRNGAAYGEGLALGRQGAGGPPALIAEGGALLERAGVVIPARLPVRWYSAG